MAQNGTIDLAAENSSGPEPASQAENGDDTIEDLTLIGSGEVMTFIRHAYTSAFVELFYWRPFAVRKSSSSWE